MNMSLIHIEAYMEALNNDGKPNSSSPVDHQHNMDIARKHGILR